MKLYSLTYHGVAPLAEAAISHNRAVITGPVGAGKSTLVDLVQIALTGTAPRGELKTLAAPNGAATSVVFEHNGQSYRSVVTSRKGKAASTFDVWRNDAWEPCDGSALSVLGVTAETLEAACFLRSKGAAGHGVFGPAGATGRRALLSTLDRELPSSLFAEWAKAANIPLPIRERIEARMDGVTLRAASMPALATSTGRDARAKLDAVAQGSARIDEVQARAMADEAAANAPAAEPVDLATAEAELDKARRQLSAAQAEAERVRKLRATREQLIAQRSDAQAKLDAMGEDMTAAATARLEALRKEWFASRDRGVACATEANTLTAEANAIESRMLDAWAVYRDAERVYTTARTTAETAAEWLRQVEAEAGPVHVPCGARKEFHACAYLATPIKARAELPAAKVAAERAAAALAALSQPEPPDPADDKARIQELRTKAAELRRLDGECRARCAAIAKESEPLKAIEAAGNAPADRLRAIIATPVPEDPGEAPDCASWVTLVAECEALVRELRVKRDAQAGAEALRKAARDNIAAAGARVATLQTALAADRAEAEVLTALERFYREAPRLAIKSVLRDIEAGANAFLTAAKFDRAVRLEETEPDAKGLWRVNVYVGDALRETLSEGQLFAVDLALSAGYRKHVGLDWYACDDGFGALGGDEAERLAPALGDGWVITHKPEVVVSLGEAGWRSVTVDEGKVTP